MDEFSELPKGVYLSTRMQINVFTDALHELSKQEGWDFDPYFFNDDVTGIWVFDSPRFLYNSNEEKRALLAAYEIYKKRYNPSDDPDY